ncbi:hypothetical protein ACJX0J_007108, partial [Zea mays]
SLGTIYEEGTPEPANGDDDGALALPETGLGLSLNTDGVLKAWCGRGSAFADGNGPDLPLSPAHVVLNHYNKLSPHYVVSAASLRCLSVCRNKRPVLCHRHELLSWYVAAFLRCLSVCREGCSQPPSCPLAPPNP